MCVIIFATQLERGCLLLEQFLLAVHARFRTQCDRKISKICTKALTIDRIVPKKICTRGTDFQKVGQMYPTFLVWFKFCPLVQKRFDYSEPNSQAATPPATPPTHLVLKVCIVFCSLLRARIRLVKIPLLRVMTKSELMSVFFDCKDVIYVR